MTAQDTAAKVTNEFERQALKAASDIASYVVTSSKVKRSRILGMSGAAFLAFAIPMLMKTEGAEELIYGAPPLLMACALVDSRKRQKELKAQFQEALGLVPEQARGIVNNELNTMEKTLMSLPDTISKKDVDLKKRGPQLLAPIFLLVPPMTPLALPSLAYLIMREDWQKTKNLIGQADAVIARNKDFVSQQPS